MRRLSDRGGGVDLRPAEPADLAFERRLYGEARDSEVAASGWPAERREAFLDSQFYLQTHHFEATFGDGRRLIVVENGQPVGRLWLHDREETRHIVDIALLTERRGQGLGTELIRQVQREARRAGLSAVTLSVLLANLGARRLYERLGFRVIGQDGAYLKMTWPAPS